jgi:hypothetical protein
MATLSRSYGTVIMWQTIETAPNNIPIMTKIDDGNGCRNECVLIKRNNLWFIPDISMYVYYTPTHWSPIEKKSN